MSEEQMDPMEAVGDAASTAYETALSEGATPEAAFEAAGAAAMEAGEAAGRAVGSDYEQRSTQAELVNRAIEGLFRRSEKPKHVLAGGYQKRREDAISGIMGVQSYHPNTTVNHIKTPAWCTLLEAVGG